MITPESAHIENSEILQMTIDEFSSRLKALSETEDRLFEKKVEGESVDFNISKLRSDFVEGLLLEKERFNKVFKTSNGSVYFHLETGETIRAKMVDDKYEFNAGEGKHFMLRPAMNDLFFLSQDESERLARVGDLYPREKIITVPYGLGAAPFEMNIKRFHSQIVFREEGGELLLIGTKSEGEEEIDIEGNLFGGTHIGHPITEIVK